MIVRGKAKTGREGDRSRSCLVSRWLLSGSNVLALTVAGAVLALLPPVPRPAGRSMPHNDGMASKGRRGPILATLLLLMAACTVEPLSLPTGAQGPLIIPPAPTTGP